MATAPSPIQDYSFLPLYAVSGSNRVVGWKPEDGEIWLRTYAAPTSDVQELDTQDEFRTYDIIPFEFDAAVYPDGLPGVWRDIAGDVVIPPPLDEPPAPLS